MSGPAFLELADVSAGYGPITVLDELSLRLAPGEILAVLGANGSGKSTVLKTIIGLARMTAGRISPARRRISAPRWASVMSRRTRTSSPI